MPITPLVPSALLLALAAPAAEPTEHLDTAEGAIEIGPTPPPSSAGLTATERPLHLGDKVLFVNFDGGQMNGCGFNSDDPTNNCSSIFNGTVLPFSGDAARRASVIQVIRKRVQDFGITVTDQRPAGGDYDMEMVGDWEGVQPQFAGIAPNIDCFDATGGETSFTLEASGSSDGIAEIVLQELAHTWGLEHVDTQSDLLFPTTQGSNKTFRDECIKIVSDTDLNPTNGFCNSVHTNFCNVGWQNSYQELLLLFGPSVPDALAPTVSIVSPADGATIEGGDLELVIAIADDQTPAVIVTDILLSSEALDTPVEAGGAYASPAELVFPIEGLHDGSYTLRVDTQDESDNPASDEITFTVVGNPVGGADDGASDDGMADGSGGGDGPGADDGMGSDDGGSADGTGGDAGLVDPTQPAAQGCDCSTSGRGREAAWMGAWALLLLVIRRRHRA